MAHNKNGWFLPNTPTEIALLKALVLLSDIVYGATGRWEIPSEELHIEENLATGYAYIRRPFEDIKARVLIRPYTWFVSEDLVNIPPDHFCFEIRNTLLGLIGRGVDKNKDIRLTRMPMDNSDLSRGYRYSLEVTLVRDAEHQLRAVLAVDLRDSYMNNEFHMLRVERAVALLKRNLLLRGRLPSQMTNFFESISMYAYSLLSDPYVVPFSKEFRESGIVVLVDYSLAFVAFNVRHVSEYEAELSDQMTRAISMFPDLEYKKRP